jgi:glycosyltransferase involved in cell wall biosynthesis
VSAILFASEYWPPFAPGGAEWSNAAWARALARRGRRVVVVTPNYGAPSREEQDGVIVLRVPFPLRLGPGHEEAAWLAHRNPVFYLYFAWQVWRAARREDAGIIHAQNKGALVPAWLAARALGRPVLVTVRDLGLACPLGLCPLFEKRDRLDCSAGRYFARCAPFFLAHYARGAGTLRRVRIWIGLALAWLDQGLRRVALARVDGVIGVSRGILSVYPERLVGGGRGTVVHTLPPAARLADEPEAQQVRQRLGIGPGPLVLYAGKLSLGKGTPVLLDALPAIRAAVPGVRFVLAGKGELDLEPAPDVHALGPIPQPDLFALYRAADVVVVPSTWPEPLSRVLLEAMAAGRPVVATAVGGTPEAVEHGVTGLLVPRRDADALAKGLIELLLDPERRRRMGAAAGQRARLLFDEERLAAALLRAYETAAGRAR